MKFFINRFPVYILVFFCMVMSFSCKEKKNTAFVLNAQLEDFRDDSVLIKDITSYLDTSYVMDASNGKFTFTQQLGSLRIYDVYYNGNSDVFTVFGDSATIVNVVINAKGAVDLNGGSPENKLLSDFKAGLSKEFNIDGDDVYACLLDSAVSGKSDSPLSVNISKVHKLASDFILSHRADYASTVVFRDYLWNSPKPDYMLMDSVLNGMNGVLHDLPYIQKAKEVIKKKMQVVPGKYVYSIAMDCLGGEKIQVYKQRDNYMFLEFWASWSDESLKFRNELKQVYKKYKNKEKVVGRNRRKVLFVGISLDTDTVACKISTLGHDVDWPQVCDMNSWASDFAVKYSVTSLPDNVLLAPNNRIVAKGLSVNELDSILNVEFNGK